MEFTLDDTDIFDINIGLIFDKLIKKNIEKFNKQIPYRMVISFDVSVIDNITLDELSNIILNDTGREIKEDDVIYRAMSSQLNRFKSVLKENGVESYWTDIQGDNLDVKNCVRILFEEDKREPTYTGRGKKKSRMSLCGIAPNMPNTRARLGSIINDRANEVFHKFMDIIPSTKIMSEILEVEETEDTNILLRAFADKYWYLVFPFSNDEEHEKALNQLREKSLSVAGKYCNKDNCDN